MNLSKTYLNHVETYCLANKIIVTLLLLVFFYLLTSLYFHSGFSCQYKLIYGTECRSCGLTRGLQSCLKFDFKTANEFNLQSTFVFTVLIGQILFRISMLLLSRKSFYKRPKNIIRFLSFDLTTCITLLIFNLKYYG